jgi:hypothetical protein
VGGMRSKSAKPVRVVQPDSFTASPGLRQSFAKLADRAREALRERGFNERKSTRSSNAPTALIRTSASPAKVKGASCLAPFVDASTQGGGGGRCEY